MGHCLDSVGILSSYEIHSDYPEGLKGEGCRIGQLQTGAGNIASRHITSEGLVKALSLPASPCEAGSLCLDPSPPFIWLKIRGLVYPLSGSGLKEFIVGF